MDRIPIRVKHSPSDSPFLCKHPLDEAIIKQLISGMIHVSTNDFSFENKHQYRTLNYAIWSLTKR